MLVSPPPHSIHSHQLYNAPKKSSITNDHHVLPQFPSPIQLAFSVDWFDQRIKDLCSPENSYLGKIIYTLS